MSNADVIGTSASGANAGEASASEANANQAGVGGANVGGANVSRGSAGDEDLSAALVGQLFDAGPPYPENGEPTEASEAIGRASVEARTQTTSPSRPLLPHPQA